jgi:hypothetical protein
VRFAFGGMRLELPEAGACEAAVEATVFDFAAMSVAFHVPLALRVDATRRLAGGLSDSAPIEAAAREAVGRLYDKLLPAIQNPVWSQLTEAYFVFEFSPEEAPAELALTQGSDWLAGLVRLEAQPLSREEVIEALRLQIRYGRDDLFVADWAAAVLIDADCSETLEVVEFANLQLLEFREIDNRLDDRLATTSSLVHVLARQWLPFWRSYTGQLRALGDLKVEANSVFERTQNSLKLVGDQYLARVYRLLATRFYLAEWQESIQRSLDVIEGAYRVLADQAAAWRAEALELLIALLVAVEIILTLLGY